MKLLATHTTTYRYSLPVSVCHTELRLAPRALKNQRLLDHKLSIQPEPEETYQRTDYFGNEAAYFSIQEPHQTLTVRASSLIEMTPEDTPDPRLTPVWEEVVNELQDQSAPEAFEALEFSFESPRILIGPEFATYAERSFTPRRPLLEASLDLCRRIHEDFSYDKEATTVTTSVAEVFQSRRGVCQDFAHFTIACLRSLGLAARYVSGYLGALEMTGAGASHAWVSVYCPGFGWLDMDPTNNVVVYDSHLTLAWGRDYSDVAPVKGVVVGGGDHIVNVAVEVARPKEEE